MRKNKQNLFYTFVILATVAVMAFFGLGDMFGGGGVGGSAPVAWVNGKIVPRSTFQFQLEQRLEQYQSLLGGNYDRNLIERLGIKTQVLNSIIDYELISQKADDLGFHVPDQELADFIRNLPYFQKDGKFDAALYNQYRTRQRDPGLLEREQREQMKVNKLRTYLASQLRLTPSEIKTGFELNETKVDLQVATIDFNELSQAHKPTASEIAAAKKAPETRFKSYYDTNLADFTQKARIQLRQIRVGVPFQASEEKKKTAKEKIDKAVKETTPANFAAMAKKYSDDEYAQKGGMAGWMDRGTLTTELEQALDKLEPNTVSPAIETPFGYFVLLVEKNQPKQVKPLASVKNQIAVELAKQDYIKGFEAKYKTAWNEKLKKGQGIESDLRRFKVKIEKTGPFAIGTGNIPKIGRTDGLMDQVFKLSPKAPYANELVFYRDKYYFIKLAKVTKADMKSFEKDKETTEKSLVSSLQNELLGKWMNDLRTNASIKLIDEFKAEEPQAAAPPSIGG